MSEPKDTNEAACGGSALTAELGAWLPIETASKRPWDFVLLAWGPEEDKSTGVGCFRGAEEVIAPSLFIRWKRQELLLTKHL